MRREGSLDSELLRIPEERLQTGLCGDTAILGTSAERIMSEWLVGFRYSVEH